MHILKSGLWVMVVLLSTRMSLAAVSEVIVFGDSLSDTGNVYTAAAQTFPPSPPYGGLPGIHDQVPGLEIAPGRFTDGLNWVEYLADNLGVTRPAPRGINPLPGGTNYAWGGATTGLTAATYTTTLGPIPPDGTVTGGQPVGAQIGTYLTDRLAGTVAAPSEETLFVYWAGSNDFLLDNERFPARTAARVALGLETLIAAGAKQILVPNAPSLESTPAIGDAIPSFFVADDISNNLDRRVNRFNNLLDRTLAQIATRHPNVSIYDVDVNGLLDSVITDPATFGLSNVTVPVVNETELFINMNPNPYPTVTSPTGFINVPPPVIFESLFWDGVHPTTVAHGIFAGAAINSLLAGPLSNVAIPEPTSAIVSTIMLMSVTTMRRRR